MTDEDKKKLADAKAAMIAEDATTAETEVVQADDAEETKTTKAGKKSAKAIREAEEEQEKEERKAKIAAGEIDASTDSDGNTESIKKGPAPKTRQKSERRSKNYKKSAALITEAEYRVEDAMALIPKITGVKFDPSVELHLNLNVDPRQADQNIRGNVVLPHGSGKTVRVAVFAPADEHAAAKKAGADLVGEETILDALKKEEIDFDILIATPALMAQLGRYAKLLGPKGLMPNPKSGTVTKDVAKAVKDAKGGQVEFRVDKQSIIHIAIGKASFAPAQLADNANSVIAAIKGARPNSIKGGYIKAIHATTSMGPSVKISYSEAQN